jgi:hypothetical protein
MMVETRRGVVYLALAAFFITDAVLAEVIGGNLFTLGPFTMSMAYCHGPWCLSPRI